VASTPGMVSSRRTSARSRPTRPSSASTIRSSWPWKSSWRSSAPTAWCSSWGRSWVASHARPLTPNRSAARAARDEIAVQDRLHLVLQPGPLPHDVGAADDLAAQREGGLIGQPHRRQEPGRQQLRQYCRVDLVSLDLGLGDRPSLLRVGDHHPAHMLFQQPRDRIGVAGRLQGHLITQAQAVGELPQCLRRGLAPSSLTHHAVLPDGDLGELAVDIQADAPAHPVLPSSSLPGEHRRANDTYGSALAAHPGESQGRPCTNSGSQPIERSPACPTCVCSRMPLSRTVAPYSSANRDHRPADPWTQAASTAFHTSYQPGRGRPQFVATHWQVRRSPTLPGGLPTLEVSYPTCSGS
jgi:hypothetical protein